MIKIIRYESVFFFVISLLLFTFGLSTQEVVGFESRFYLFALEMWRHGAGFFPTTYGAPYPDYPGTAIGLIYLSAKAAGVLNKGIAVFPSAMAASLTVMMTYQLGALRERVVGIAAGFFLWMTIAFVREARTISLDQYVTLMTVISFYVVYSASIFQKFSRLYWLPFLLILSFIFRGPIGLVIPAGVVCSFYFLEKDWKRLLKFILIAGPLLIICCGLLLGVAYLTGGMSFVHEVIRMQVAGRMQVDQTPPFYFYFIESVGAYAVTYPLVLISLLFYGKKWLRNDFILKLFGWVLIILIGLSIPADKKVRYILPMAPALALICAEAFFQLKKIKLKYLVIAAVVVYAGYIFLVEPINLKLNRTHAFVMKVEQWRAARNATLVFYQEGSDGLAIKYAVNMPEEDKIIFIDKVEQLKQIPMPATIIANEENFQTLAASLSMKIKEVMRGKIGHKKVVVFEILSNKISSHPVAGF